MQLMRWRLRHQRISCIFISHLHGDHYFGLFGLLSTMHLNGRTAPIHLYGPPGLAEILPPVFRHSGTNLNFELCFHPIDTARQEVILDNETLTVETIPLHHRVPCCGFLFREKLKQRRILKEKLPPQISWDEIAQLKNGHDVLDEEGNVRICCLEVTSEPKRSRTYAYCSDTSYSEEIIPQIKDVDLLYHEATFMSDLHDRALQTGHSTARQAAAIARKAQASRLLLGHFSSRYKELEPLLAEAREVFPESELAIEGALFSVPE